MARRYKCPYCEKRLERKPLIDHIDKEHEEMIPDGYTAARVVYNMVNKTDHGTCRVCKSNTPWNEKAGRYDVLCGDPKCKEHMREQYKQNMLRVKGTYNILNDPEQQKKMLANRSISGTYKFTDGGVLTYTGSYEKKCLEFMDLVMQIPSKDILSPGPTLEYEYNGEKHFYITDFYYIPYNLIIEVKDGGDNPNTKHTQGMITSREKTIEKEHLITSSGEYNYIRLTNNNFAQLIDVFMNIKMALLNGDSKKVIKINESEIILSESSCMNSEYYGYHSNMTFFDEAVFNEETLLSNGDKPKHIYHLSDVNHDGEIFEPRYYKGDNYKSGNERGVKRVCFSDHINGALLSIVPQGATDGEMFVHIPDSDVKVYSTDTNDIYDSNATHELWVKEPVKMKCIGKIKIIGMDTSKSRTTVNVKNKHYNKVKLFDFKWKWIKKFYDIETLYESCLLEQADLTKFTWYHAEVKRPGFNPKVAGGWDEELYSKDIKSCINNDVKWSPYAKGKEKVEAYLYTAGEDLTPIYLGIITVYLYEDKFDWEWSEQQPIPDSEVSYLRDEVQKHLLEMKAIFTSEDLKRMNNGLPPEDEYDPYDLDNFIEDELFD